MRDLAPFSNCRRIKRWGSNVLIRKSQMTEAIYRPITMAGAKLVQVIGRLGQSKLPDIPKSSNPAEYLQNSTIPTQLDLHLK